MYPHVSVGYANDDWGSRKAFEGFISRRDTGTLRKMMESGEDVDRLGRFTG